MDLQTLISLPWTIRGPEMIVDGDQTHWEITIAELPDFFMAGQTWREVISEYPEALKAYLRSYTDRGQVPSLPPDPLVWRVFVPKPVANPPSSVQVPTVGAGSVTSVPITSISVEVAAGMP
jgi:hypothetical protein